MTTSGSVHDIAEFLSAHDPFVVLEPAKLERLAERAEIEYFDAGVTIFRQGEDPPETMWVVRTGAVELRESGRLLDLLGEGEPFGHPWMLSGLPTGWEARTRESSLCYRLAADDVIPLLSEPAGLRSVARALMHRPRPEGASSARAGVFFAGQDSARNLIRARPLVCEPDVSLRRAAALMEETGADCVLVEHGEGELGILTDRDLRSRVVAPGRSLETPVAEVMSVPAITAGAEQTSAELMLTMLDRGIRHLPIRAPRGELLGVVSDVDLLAAETRTPFMLRRSIAAATEFEQLRDSAARLNQTLIRIHEAGVPAVRTSGMLSVVVDALVRRLIELAVAERGAPPAELGWLSLGSFGRREAVPSSDVDSGMVWSDDAGAEPGAYMRDLAREVVGELAAIGWPPDAHGVTATGAMSASSMSDWRAAIGEWLREPISERQLIAISIVLDAREIYGPDGGLDVPALLRRASPRPALLRLLLRLALKSRPPTGFLKNIVVEHSGAHAGKLDIKRGGLLPVVNIARYAGHAAGATTTSTIERLRAGADAGTLREGDAATLEEAFELFSELRLDHQIAQLGAASAPDDQIDPRTLNPLNRRYLRDAFRAVASVQRGLTTKLAWDT